MEAVVDASVVVKWYVEEEHSPESIQLRDSFLQGSVELFSTSLMPYEVLNALAVAKSDAAFIKTAAESLAAYDIRLVHPDGSYLSGIVEFCAAGGISFYDASYVALARELGAVLYTADSVLIKCMRERGRKFVKHISDFAPGQG